MTDKTVEMKICSECNQNKNVLLDFSKSQKERNYSICRACNTKLGQEYRAKNKDKMKEYDKKYRKKILSR